MDPEEQTQAVETETPAVPASTGTGPTLVGLVQQEAETPETQTPETQTTDLSKLSPAELIALVATLRERSAAEEGKRQRAVEAEKKARQKASQFETELTTFRTDANVREAERVAALSDKQAREEAEAALAKERERTQGLESRFQDFRVETELSAAGFLNGFEGEERTAQLTTLKALTNLELVKEDGQFSISRFSERFAAMKPAAAAVVPTPEAAPVVDLGGKTPAPSEQAATRKTQLLEALKTAEARGQRSNVIALRSELSRLK